MPSPRSRNRRDAARGSQPSGARRQPPVRAKGLRRSGAQRSSLQRVLHVERLRRKAGTPLWRGPSPRRQLALTLAPIALLLLVVLTLFIGRRYTSQKLDVETSIRAQLVPALEKQLGKKVEIGSIESDYFSRLILRDVVVGRDQSSPVGALMQAKTVTLSIDAVNLVLHRDNPLLAISRVVLDSPQLDLRRDARGQFNLTQLFKSKPTGGPKWRGLVEANNGRVYYEDLMVRSSKGRALVADASGITARARFNAADPITYTGSARSTLLGQSRAPISNARVAGTAAANGSWISLDANVPRAPAPLLAEYAFRRGEIVAQSGVLGGRFRVMWDKALPRAAQFNVGGQVQLQNVSGFLNTFKEPGTNQPLVLQKLSGALRFSDKSFEAQNLALTALSTPLRATGSFTLLPRPIFDLRLASNAFNTNRLLGVFRQSAASGANANRQLADTLRVLQLRTGNARGEVRVSGDAKNWSAEGAVGLPATALSHPRWGAWSASTLSSRFDLKNAAGKFAVKAIVNAQNARGSQSQAGAWQTSGTLAADVQWTNALSPAPLQVRFSVPSASGRGQSFGAWRGDTVSGVLRTSSATNAPLAVQLSVAKLAGRHPQFGIAGARGLFATLNASSQNTRNANFALSATAQSATGNNAQWGQIQTGALRIGGSGNFRNARFAVNSRSTRARHAQWGAAQLGALQANVRFENSRLFARWNARGANLQNAQAGSWRAASLVGAVNTRSTRGAAPVSLDVEARGFSGRHARYGFLAGEAVRATASTPDARRASWSGVAAVGRTDPSRANLAAFSPSLAKQIRDVGTITGKARFSNFSPNGNTDNVVVKGRARLSQIVVVQGRERFALRDVETNVAFGGREVRLSGLTAQSQFGALQADAQSDLRGGLRFSILAPNVALSATQINHYLAPSGVTVTGSPRVRLRLSAAGSNDFAQEAPVVRATFNIALPQGSVRWTDRARGASTPAQNNFTQGARLQNAALRGEGVLRFGGATDWSYTGNLALAATHAVQDAAVQSALRLANLRLLARGSLQRTASGITPNFAGEARAQKLLLPLPDKSTRTGTAPFLLENARGEFVLTPQLWQVPRFSAEAGGESRLVGHATLRPQNRNNLQRISANGQLLLEKFDASQARRVLLTMQSNDADSNQIPDVRGVLFARADFSGEFQNGAPRNMEIGLQARLYNGVTRWATATGELNEVPIDAARIATTLTLPRRSDAPINIEEAALWSEGGRLAASGVLTPQGETFALDLNASLHTLRMRRLVALPSLRPSLQRVADEGDLDGLLSGEFKIRGTTAAPRIEGRAAMRLANAFGFEIQNASGELDVYPQQTASGAQTLYIGLTKIEGRITGAESENKNSENQNADSESQSTLPPNFSGEFIADGAANDWHLNLNTGEIGSGRLLMVAEQSGDTRTRGWRNIPISGTLRAGVTMRGTLRDEDGNARFAANSGEISVQSGGENRQLRWKGRDLGALNARLQLLNGVLQVRQFELAGQTQTGEATSPSTDRPLLQISGVLPVSLDAPSLDAEVIIENQQLSFVIEVLREIREALESRGQNVTYLNAVLQRIEGLPPTLDGDIDLRAHLDQSWRAPVVAVSSLRVNDMFYRTASGTRKTLPNLQASFIYDGNDNGAVAIRSAELRLPRAQSTPGVAAGNQSTPDNNDGDELVIRTLQPGRIVPQGEMSLQVEVVNADLEQLADWVPTLRNIQGQPIVRGRLSDFVVELGGTTGAPEITGSLQGENWTLQQYSLDRVRLDQFRIANGQLRVEPGYLTIVKGDFQSDAAWGFLPWSWGDDDTAPGLDTARPLEVHFPIDRENFGALAGIFVPALENVGADAFNGDVTATGTLLAPQLAGEATITNGRFRVRSTYAELDAGIANLNGTLRFVNGNRLELGEGGLRGNFVSANSVQAPQTGNAPSEARVARDERKKRNKGEAPNAPRLAGDFLLAGSATLDLDPRTLASPRATLSNHRYDLRLALAGGSYATSEISGVRDVNGAVIWKTGDGAPRTSQQLRWALSASAGEKKQGRLASFAALRLSPNFGESMDAAMRSRAEAFYSVDDFRNLSAMWSTLGSNTAATALQAVLQNADGAPGHVGFNNFQISWENVARGSINGNLLIDNGASTQPPVPLPFDVDAPPAPVATAQAKALTSSGKTAAVQSAKSKAAKPIANKPATVTNAAQSENDVARVQNIQQSTPAPAETPRNGRGSGGENRGGENRGGTRGQSTLGDDPGTSPNGTPLRFSGELSLEEAELYGAPANLDRNRRLDDEARITEVSTGAASRGALGLPDAPVFNVRLRAGRDVEFVSSNLRATITGDLMATGTPRDPVLLGTLYTRGGQITFPNARARLISGELNIAARRDVSGVMRLRVEIDVTARGRSGRYEITIRLRGPLDTGEPSTQDLRVDVSSNPPLSSDEAFAQLLGTTILNRGNLGEEGNENYARAIVGFLSGPLFSGIERTLEDALGLDTIALDYRIDEPIGIEIGKAIGDRLFITYRRALQSTAGEKTPFELRIDYRIKGDIELGIETNERDERKLTIQKRWRF